MDSIARGITSKWPRSPGVGILLFSGFLALAFLSSLWELLLYSVSSDLYSYIPLIPFVSAYIIWLKQEKLRGLLDRSPRAALLALTIGAGVLITYWTLVGQGWQVNRNDKLTLMMSAFLSLLLGGGFLFLGAGVMRAIAFPAGILFFMVPPPTFLISWITSFLQHASAEAGYALLSLVGEPILRRGLIFQLSGMTIEVAEECSGIHSSLVLFITSLLAGYLFLRTPWKRTVLTLAVIPLAILRNGFRIFTIAMLCVHVDPRMIDSPIHHRGGPIFFVLSLVPFLAFLFVLRRSERQKNSPPAVIASSPGKEPLA
jgi:exosortase C (VPDSG-CTERM-specific)